MAAAKGAGQISFRRDHNGDATTVTDANGHITSSIFQTNSSRLSASVDANGFRTSFQYDNAGQQIALTDGRSNTTTFAYDQAGRMTTQQDPLNNVTTWLYDAAGRNTTQIDAKATSNRWFTTPSGSWGPSSMPTARA